MICFFTVISITDMIANHLGLNGIVACHRTPGLYGSHGWNGRQTEERARHCRHVTALGASKTSQVVSERLTCWIMKELGFILKTWAFLDNSVSQNWGLSPFFHGHVMSLVGKQWQTKGGMIEYDGMLSPIFRQDISSLLIRRGIRVIWNTRRSGGIRARWRIFRSF